jgi:poly(3-hydroxybutyrate) depolymerase
LCSNINPKNRKHLEVPGAGHYGIFSGRRWRDVVYPEVVKFILAHNGSGSIPKASSKTAVKASAKPASKAPAKKAVKVAAKKATARKK